MTDFKSFREAIEGEYVWPAAYTFKFLIKENQLEELKSIVKMDQFTTRPSKNGKYLAVNFTKMIINTEQIIDIYKSVQVIEGIICL